jgi:peptidoglycan/LPS O-acetylase OafA/YrhL
MRARGLGAGQQPVIALDLLRGLAALLVVVGHVKQSTFVAYANLPPQQQGWITKAAFALSRLGHEAVLVFFVLSGLLVGGRVLELVAEGRFDLTKYAVDRFSRIMLPLVPAIVLTVILDALVFDQRPDVMQALAHVVGLNGVLAQTFAHNVPLWSLAYEIWFYVLAAAVAYLIATRRPSAPAFIAIALSVAVFSVLSARYLVFWTAGAFSILMLPGKSRGSMAALGVLLGGAGVVFYQLTLPASGLQMQIVVPSAMAEAMIAIGVCLILPLMCDPGFNRGLTWLRAPAGYLSAMSYTLYLTHFPINAVLDKTLPHAVDLSWPALGQFALRLAVIVLVAQGFYCAFEARTTAVRAALMKYLAHTDAVAG